MIQETDIYFFYLNSEDLSAGYAAEYFKGKDGLQNTFPNICKLNLADNEKPSTQIDLLIVEDGFYDITRLIKAALKCEEIRTIAICYGTTILERLIAGLDDSPKIITLDFELKRANVLREASIEETMKLYKKIEENALWKNTVILGITYHAKVELSQELLDAIHTRNDSVYLKTDALWDFLPDILWDAVGRYETRCKMSALESTTKALTSPEPTVEVGAPGLKMLVPSRKLSGSPNLFRGRTQQVEASDRFSDRLLVGESPLFIYAIEKALKVASYRRVTVLLLGESGVGKELFAKEIFYAVSHKTRDCFVPVNCGAIPKDLAESELFGHVRGAFTTAIKNKRGFFEQADGGTIFLDEVDTLSLDCQVKLLRVIEERKIHQVGGNGLRDVDVQIIAATNRDLKEAMQKGEFRQDLYYRLSVIPILIPPLRNRRDDIPLLTKFFVQQQAAELDKEPPTITEDAMQAIREYDSYPGNVRQLKNRLLRLLMLSNADTITRENVICFFPDTADEGFAPESGYPENDILEQDMSRVVDRLNKYESGFENAKKKINGKILLRDIGNHCDPPMAHPSISQFFNPKNKDLKIIRELAKQFPDRWPLLRKLKQWPKD